YASYGLALWQTDPRGLYLAMCSPACTSMHRLHPDRQPISYELPEWQKFDAFSPVRYWHYQLSPEGEFLVLASATQVAVFAVDQAKAPLAVMDLPTDYNGYSLGSISVGPRAESLILGLYKSKDFGIDFVAEILELTRTGKTLSLDRGFAERARAAGEQRLRNRLRRRDTGVDPHRQDAEPGSRLRRARSGCGQRHACRVSDIKPRRANACRQRV